MIRYQKLEVGLLTNPYRDIKISVKIGKAENMTKNKKLTNQ